MINYIITVNDRVVHRVGEKPNDKQLYKWARYYYPYPVTLSEVISVTKYQGVTDDRTSIEDIVCGIRDYGSDFGHDFNGVNE